MSGIGRNVSSVPSADISGNDETLRWAAMPGL
jgi:hypothetical protein